MTAVVATVRRIMRGGWAIRSAALGATVLMAALAGGARAEALAIVNARIYPDPQAAAIDAGTVLVRDGRIVEVGTSVTLPDDARVVDADGGVVTAGFWNSHAHVLPLPLREAETRSAAKLDFALRRMFTGKGFTTVFDIASFPSGNAAALRRRIEDGEVTGPALLTVDAPFFPDGGTPSYVQDLLDTLQVPSAEVATAEAARARARDQLEHGADGVKLFIGAIVDDGKGVVVMDATIAKAVVDEAHRRHKPVFAHPTTLAGVEVALEAGVDVLAHTTPTGGPWNDVLAKRLVEADIALTPTLALFEIEVRKDQAPESVVAQVVSVARQQLRAFHQAGGQVLFGTDVGYVDLFETRREFELMADADMDWRAILASLTTTPARRFGQGDRKGRVWAGMDADLVVLASDPADDPTAFADVRHTVRGGALVHSARMAAVPSSRPGVAGP
ncbi:amidohydrolase family protein [Marilutibacter maris]|nr:amidohydrolase family protein [Lysobacter maris]